MPTTDELSRSGTGRAEQQAGDSNSRKVSFNRGLCAWPSMAGRFAADLTCLAARWWLEVVVVVVVVGGGGGTESKLSASDSGSDSEETRRDDVGVGVGSWSSGVERVDVEAEVEVEVEVEAQVQVQVQMVEACEPEPEPELEPEPAFCVLRSTFCGAVRCGTVRLLLRCYHARRVYAQYCSKYEVRWGGGGQGQWRDGQACADTQLWPSQLVVTGPFGGPLSTEACQIRRRFGDIMLNGKTEGGAHAG